MIYAHAKFAGDSNNGLGGDSFTRNVMDRPMNAHIDGHWTRLLKKKILKRKAGIITYFDSEKINTSVILLLNIHLNISVYGQDIFAFRDSLTLSVAINISISYFSFVLTPTCITHINMTLIFQSLNINKGVYGLDIFWTILPIPAE